MNFIQRMLLVSVGMVFLCTVPVPAGGKNDFFKPGQLVLFLGDSNTYAGQFVVLLEAELRRQYPAAPIDLLNVGLPSETASGLSEPDHPFPRPDVYERLDRVLAKTKPDIVVASYGMNDGIYYPFSEERFDAYKKGIQKLANKVKATGAKLVLLTPSPFDPPALKKQNKLLPKGAAKYAWFAIYENYDDEVLAVYAKWLMEQKGLADLVVDIHTPMREYAKLQRAKDPNYMLCGDSIHYGPDGHRLVSEAILKAWGCKPAQPTDKKTIELITKRQFLLRDAWLTETGHKRPGVNKGMPLSEAVKQARQLDAEIRKPVEK